MQQINNPYSDLKILCHPDKIKAILQEERTSPLYVRIKPTNVCNQKCWYCVYANDSVIDNRNVDRRESIPWAKMKEIINDLSEMGTKAITFSGGGEPLCYPYIYDALDMVQKHGMDYAMISNGQGLEDRVISVLKSAKWVRISFDSTDRELYKKTRGVDTFSKVVDNIKQFAIEKDKSCVLGVNFVVTKNNYKEIYDMCDLLASIGVNNIKFSPLMVKGTNSDYHMEIKAEVEEQLAKAVEKFQSDTFCIIDKYTNDESLEKNFVKSKRCHIKEVFTVIGADCKVYYCHQRAYTRTGEIGDLTNQSFKELWFSEQTTKKFREMKPQRECNFRCAFEERNQLLESLVNMDRKHINFI